MSEKLKVFAVGNSHAGRRVVAAKSQTEARRFLGVTLKTLREFGRVSQQADEVEAAMREPGRVFATRVRPYGRRVESGFRPEALNPNTEASC